MRLELVLIDLHSRGEHAIANALSEINEPVPRLRTHPAHPSVPGIWKESASAKTGVERRTGIDVNPVDNRFLLLAQKSERQMLRLRTHPRRFRKPRPQLLETLIERTEDLRRKTRSDEQPHFWKRQA